MGLDLSAYSNLQLVECSEQPCDDHVHVYPNSDFPGRADRLVKGCYTYGKRFHFRGGSYSGFNEWREWLSDIALGVSPREVWDDPERFVGKPFVELINFSDCEGVIGPETSAKLAKDFAEHAQEAARRDTGYEYLKYRDWWKAFELAAGNGGVIFR